MPEDAPSEVPVRISGEVDVWPRGLIDEDREHSWVVVRCLPRQEKRLAEDLRRRAIPGCLFFERRLRHYPGKGMQEHRVPLLAGYVFAAIDYRRRFEVYRTRRAMRVLEVVEPRSLRDDLRNLAHLIAASPSSLVVRPEIVRGSRIAITSGSLAGCVGVVVRRRGAHQLVVNLELLGHSVAAELPAHTAELVEAG